MTSREPYQDAFDVPGLRGVSVDGGIQPPTQPPPRRKATIDDGMNPELVAGADFDGILGIPIIKRPSEFVIPSSIIPFSKRNRDADPDLAVGFYEMDVEFADVLINPDRFINEFRRRPLISPDCSLYRDAPLAVQIANTYKSRAIGHYYQSHGVYVIPQIRWGNRLTYTTEELPERLAFLGVEKHSIVAIGTYGCIRTADDKHEFQAGLSAMMETLEPKVVLVYGPMPEQVFGPYAHDATFKQYDDWTSRMKDR
ncbi:DUF4417 domain-containing protein [Bifidobacterium aesculapii]|uniref:DUF4417 domain-containing protein n=1 Tax=Bifidobacterium aesculapii TaxID=1329411 RepID=UPI0009E67283|nr:DUF4417 domain-containing protein [Bifidobacterium aesculapii]